MDSFWAVSGIGQEYTFIGHEWEDGGFKVDEQGILLDPVSSPVVNWSRKPVAPENRKELTHSYFGCGVRRRADFDPFRKWLVDAGIDPVKAELWALEECWEGFPYLGVN